MVLEGRLGMLAMLARLAAGTCCSGSGSCSGSGRPCEGVSAEEAAGLGSTSGAAADLAVLSCLGMLGPASSAAAEGCSGAEALSGLLPAVHAPSVLSARGSPTWSVPDGTGVLPGSTCAG